MQIYIGAVKGYLSDQRRKVVYSKAGRMSSEHEREVPAPLMVRRPLSRPLAPGRARHRDALAPLAACEKAVGMHTVQAARFLG